MRIVFDPRAQRDLEQLFAWIAKDNLKAAADMVTRIEARVQLLATPGFSQMGRPGLVKGTRELVVAPYVVVYKVGEAREIVVLSVVHGAQDRRP